MGLQGRQLVFGCAVEVTRVRLRVGVAEGGEGAAEAGVERQEGRLRETGGHGGALGCQNERFAQGREGLGAAQRDRRLERHAHGDAAVEEER